MSTGAKVAFAIIGALFATTGCRQRTAWPPEPAPVQFGEDVCGACSMINSDPTYAAQIRTAEGTVQVFDDIGCMLTKAGTNTDPVGVFVRSADGSRWLRGDSALVLKASGIASPMGYGFVAFADPSAAEAAARVQPGGVVFELRSLLGGPPPSAHLGAGTEISVKGEVRE
jgi:copper chaperone NosL